MGHFWRLIREPSGEPLRAWVHEVPNDGVIMYPDFFNWGRVAVVKPKALTEVMVTRSNDYVKPPHIKKGLGAIFGSGLVFLEGEKHRIQRKELMPAFAFGHVRDLYPVFWGKATGLVKALRAYTADSRREADAVVHVTEWASRATLDIIGLAGLGQDFNTIEDPSNELSKTYRQICSPSKTALLLGVLGFAGPTRLLGSLLIKFTDDFISASRTVKSHCYSLVEAKKYHMRKADEAPSIDILSVALHSGNISDDDLVNHLMTFLLAGHETISSSLTWAIYYLCKYPSIQTRLRAELATRLPQARDATWSPTAAEIEDLPYLHAVCHEVVRLRPPVPTIPRMANVDTSIVGHFIPKGTIIILPPWAVNTSKELWGEDAAEFNPERWMGPGRANTGGAESAYSFLTFLKGPRGCIGENFAWAELTCLVAAWVVALQTEFAEEDYIMVVENGITARPSRLDVKLKVLGA
ncbi:hypothetical protein MMC30_000468 [Trapelia coarctata]|nr:hypothetical protein [Trapelia coarctata]